MFYRKMYLFFFGYFIFYFHPCIVCILRSSLKWTKYFHKHYAIVFLKGLQLEFSVHYDFLLFFSDG